MTDAFDRYAANDPYVRAMRRYETDPVSHAKVQVGAQALLVEGPPDLEWEAALMMALVVLTAVENAP